MSKDFFEDLSKRTGLSEEHLRRVLQEVKALTIESLAKLNTIEVPIPGIATFYCNKTNVPDLMNGGEKVKLTVRCRPSTAISRGIEKVLSSNGEPVESVDMSNLLKYDAGAGCALFGSKVRAEQIEALR